MSRRSTGPAVAAALVLGLAVAGCGGSATATAPVVTRSAGVMTVSPSATASPGTTSAGSPSAGVGPPTASATAGAAGSSHPQVTTTHALVVRGPQALPAAANVVPSRIQIPALGVDSTLEHLKTVKGVLQPPVDPLAAGWWAGGPVPGDPGPAVIAGHLDSYTGPAVFIHLSELKAGDSIVVTRSNGTRVAFTVDAVQTYEKSAFPTAAVYGPVPGAALRLITCGGTFDRQKQLYLANVVVYASLAG